MPFLLDLWQVGLEDIGAGIRSEEHTSELQSQSNLVCRLLLEKKKNICTRCAGEPNTPLFVEADATDRFDIRCRRYSLLCHLVHEPPRQTSPRRDRPSSYAGVP